MWPANAISPQSLHRRCADRKPGEATSGPGEVTLSPNSLTKNKTRNMKLKKNEDKEEYISNKGTN